MLLIKLTLNAWTKKGRCSLQNMFSKPWIKWTCKSICKSCQLTTKSKRRNPRRKHSQLTSCVHVWWAAWTLYATSNVLPKLIMGITAHQNSAKKLAERHKRKCLLSSTTRCNNSRWATNLRKWCSSHSKYITTNNKTSKITCLCRRNKFTRRMKISSHILQTRQITSLIKSKWQNSSMREMM